MVAFRNTLLTINAAVFRLLFCSITQAPPDLDLVKWLPIAILIYLAADFVYLCLI